VQQRDSASASIWHGSEFFAENLLERRRKLDFIGDFARYTPGRPILTRQTPSSPTPSITREAKPSDTSLGLVGKYLAFKAIRMADYLAVRDRFVRLIAEEARARDERTPSKSRIVRLSVDLTKSIRELVCSRPTHAHERVENVHECSVAIGALSQKVSVFCQVLSDHVSYQCFCHRLVLISVLAAAAHDFARQDKNARWVGSDEVHERFEDIMRDVWVPDVSEVGEYRF